MICPCDQWRVATVIMVKAELLGGQLRCDQRLNRRHQCRQRDILHVIPHRARLDTRIIEDLVHQPQQVALADANASQIFRLRCRHRPAHAELHQLRVATDRTQRRAQLMTHRRQKLRLAPVRALGVAPCSDGVLSRPLAVTQQALHIAARRFGVAGAHGELSQHVAQVDIGAFQFLLVPGEVGQQAATFVFDTLLGLHAIRHIVAVTEHAARHAGFVEQRYPCEVQQAHGGRSLVGAPDTERHLPIYTRFAPADRRLNTPLEGLRHAAGTHFIDWPTDQVIVAEQCTVRGIRHLERNIRGPHHQQK